DYIAKPVSPAALARLLSKWLPKAPKGNHPEEYAVEQIRSEVRALAADIQRSPKVAELFLRFVPGQIDSIAEGLARQGTAQVRSGAHKLKGSCMAIGATAMARACALLEPCPPNAADILRTLRVEFARVRAELLAETGEHRRLDSRTN